MKYNIVDNFLEQNECTKLVQEVTEFLKQEDMIDVQNKRKLLPSTSLQFLRLINLSGNWKKLHDKLNSQSFLDFIINKLNIEKKTFLKTDFFFEKNPSETLAKYKNLGQKKVILINNKSLLKYLIYRSYRYLKRLFKYKFTYKNYVELIYDYSISSNGYKREIHRDSDSRTFVFLLYLNQLGNEGEGGELEFYKYNRENNKIPSMPDYKDCTLLKKISPKEGRLVIFENSFDSFHAVNEMKNYKDSRHFLYGSFTLLAKQNKYLKKNTNSLETEFNIFD